MGCDASQRSPRTVHSVYLVVDVGIFCYFLNALSVPVRRLMGVWACLRTPTPSMGWGNRSSRLTLLSRPGGIGTSRISCLGWTSD